MLLESGSLFHDPKMGTFTVKGSSDKRRKRPIPGITLNLKFLLLNKMYTEDYNVDPAPDSIAKKKPVQSINSPNEVHDHDTLTMVHKCVADKSIM